MTAEGRTDIGKVRSQNQDAFFISSDPIGPLPNLFVVADGMGGHNAGDIASSYALECFCNHVKSVEALSENESALDVLVAAASSANKLVLERARSDNSLEGMGTTLTACVAEEKKCLFVHIGDSRAYYVTGKGISQITSDHTYVYEMIKAGQLTPELARTHPKRNVLTRVLGIDSRMQADGYVKETEQGGYVLLCSDGLTSMLSDKAIQTIVLSKASLEKKVSTLINRANEKGGTDNISIVLVKLD